MVFDRLVLLFLLQWAMGFSSTTVPVVGNYKLYLRSIHNIRDTRTACLTM